MIIQIVINKKLNMKIFGTFNTQIRTIYNNFLAKYPSNQAALNHARFQVLNILADPDYKRLVTSSIGFSPVMWQIAKELIGDKAVDILIGLIPGFGNADELKDAIKAAKNGDWFEFTFEVGKIVGQNTPWGKMLKIGDAGSTMYQFCKKIERISDKIGTWSSTRATKAWGIIKKSIKSPIATNPDYWKYVDDLSFPKFGNSTTTNHLDVFDSTFPDLRTDMQIHHAAPRALLSRYPNLSISQNQMHSIENLRGIPNSLKFTKPDGQVISLHQHITNLWNTFYNNNTNVTNISTIFNEAKKIDDQYGHLFCHL